MTKKSLDPERLRLEEDNSRTHNWKRWGPYLSERQWGTVREDYSPGGSAWDYFPHEHARSRAYRWGEDGLMGISDRHQYVCFSIALWNGKDPILKERLFGLTGSQGNHGEDVKECYYYLDSTPTHSYMKALYKYPQREFPYRQLVDENRTRGRRDPEFELLDSGLFDDDRYFDVFTEYAKASPDDILIRVRVFNRGPEAATVHLLPTLWFRNTWSWGLGARRQRLRGGRAGRGLRDDRRGERVLRPPRPVLRGRARAALHRERVERAAPLGRRQRLGARQGRHPRLRRERQAATPCIPNARARRAPPATS